MIPQRLRAPLLAAAVTLGLGGCIDDGYGYGLGYGYGGGYYDAPYYGWYDDYYYPGTGFYVYDNAGGRHNWNDRQRDYWQRRGGNRGSRPENWGGYRQPNGQIFTPEQRQQWMSQHQSGSFGGGRRGGGNWQGRHRRP